MAAGRQGRYTSPDEMERYIAGWANPSLTMLEQDADRMRAVMEKDKLMDPDVFRLAMEMVRDGEARRQRGAGLRKAVLRQHDPSEIAGRVEAVYKNILK